MKYTLLLMAIVTMQLVSCRKRKMETLNSPLVTVIKLHAAEALLDFTEAKRYEDINKIYKDPSDSNANPEDIWREYITSLYNTSKSSKIFTNQFKYFEYDILEKTDGDSAEVILKSKNPNDNLQAIVYKLEKRQSEWFVFGIEYRKKE